MTPDNEQDPQASWLDAVARLPWWACVWLAIFSYVALHALTLRPQAIVTDDGSVALLVGEWLAGGLWNSLQLLVPALCLSALLAKRLRLRTAAADTTPGGVDAARAMSAWEFERLAGGGLRARRPRGKTLFAIAA